MSTQLRLITRVSAPTDGSGASDGSVPTRPLRARANSPRHPAARRTVHWEGRWRLDERTRAVGRAGVASARAALAKAHAGEADDLRRAS